MVEKAKRRFLPWLLAIMIAALLAVSGIGLIGFDSAKANASDKTDAAAEAEEDTDYAIAGGDGGMDEDVDSSVTYPKYEYNYTGKVQSVKLSKGSWKFELWGAQGGQGKPYQTVVAGANGGYVTGTWTFTADTTVYIVVGGQGGTKAEGSYSNRQNDADRAPGGYNGGGYSGANGGGARKGGGGGATHVATTNRGVLSNYKSYQSEVLIVAGGGGACGGYSTAQGANCRPGVGGGTTGGNGSGGYEGKGGTQTAGGASTRGGACAGSFGQGGNGILPQSIYASSDWVPSAAGGGGGGGWYGGSGGDDYGGGGGGGSSYTKSGMTNVSHTQGNRAGNGFARITRVNSAPRQSSVPGFTIEREAFTRFNINTASGTGSGAKGHLNVIELDPNESGRIRTAGIFMAANNTTNAANLAGNVYWLEYTAAVNSDYISVRARRWWSGTKRFYINIRDFNSSTSEYLGGNVWIAFDLSCVNGSYSDSGKTTSAANVALKYGSSTAGATVKTAPDAGVIYNPLGASRRTVWLRDPVAASATTINISQLFAQTQGTAPNYLKTEALVFAPSITYGTTRYNKDTGASQAISGGNSSAYTTVTQGGAVSVTKYNGSAVSTVTGGYTSISLKAKQGVAAGPYYYTMTVTVQLLDRKSAAVIKSDTVDIIYRVDNTRPRMANDNLVYNLAPGQTQAVPLSAICTDPDQNTLTIADVVVPSHEYVGLDQYGNIVSTNLSHYNKGTQPAYNATHKSVTETAQNPNETTEFATTMVYKTTGSGANSSFASSQSQGTQASAYVGYYTNAANNTLYLVGNKASRNAYKTGRVGALGHFYILVKVIDSGNPDDAGIWFPVAVSVSSVAPVAAGYPQVSGKAGEKYYFTPLGVQTAGSGGYFGIGTYISGNEADGTAFLDDVESDNGGKNVLPFAYDPDNYTDVDLREQYNSGSANGVSFKSPTAGKRATYPQRDMAFIIPDSASESNAKLFDTNYDSLTTDAVGIDNGFKEFFTVSRVKLYASTSILYGLTDDEIAYLINNRFISIEKATNLGNNDYVSFYGIEVTLKKHTMGKFVSFNVYVMDSHKVNNSIRIAVNVANNEISEDSARSNYAPKNNYNTRNNLTTRVSDGSAAFEFRMKVNDRVNITPYDLFYDPDTYAVNGGKEGVGAVYNTYVGAPGHSNMMMGINKSIMVYAADTAEANPGVMQNLPLKKISLASSEVPPIYGGDIYAKLHYHAEDTINNVSDYIEIEATRRTPAGGYVSFNYTVATTAGGTATVEIRIIVENTLPVVRDEISAVHADPNDDVLPFRLTASTDLTYVNSSQVETSTGGYFRIDNNSYNVREFALSDLFRDPDGDAVRFYSPESGIKVGTKDTAGNFLPFNDARYGNIPNKYVNAYIGAGSNNRAANSSCLIIQGLSSTQGVPGGVWISFDIIDNAPGSTTPATVYFQVEVKNSTPTFADMTGTNAMANIATKNDAEGNPVPDNDNPKYTWVEEAGDTGVTVANIFKDDPSIRGTNGSVITLVDKPMYIASDMSVMEDYAAVVNERIDDLQSNISLPFDEFTYSESQVRTIARDADGAQGLALWGAGYSGPGSTTLAPGFNVVTELKPDGSNTVFDAGVNSAVIVSSMYDNVAQKYYNDNNVVQILFFNDDGDLVTDADEANECTNWVIAFNFTEQPSPFEVRIRLRDGNGVINLPTVSVDDDSNPIPNLVYNTGTVGGHTKLSNSSAYNTYYGRRTVVENEDGTKGFAYNAVNSALYKDNGIFGFSVSKRSQGLYNNFSKWMTSATITSTDPKLNGLSLNNVWAPVVDGTAYSYEKIGATYMKDYGLFTYNGIAVDTGKRGARVPISYFAWPAGSKTSANRGSAQTSFAWYDIDDFAIADQGSGSGVVASDDAEFAAITLSDGYNSWSGTTLNKNPYVTFGTIRDNDPAVSTQFGASNNHDVVNNYLHGQQRFTVTKTGSNVTYNDLPVIDTKLANQYFFEDQYGLIITKKSLRSVKDLKLTIRFANWQKVNSNYSKVRLEDGTIDTITVTVPLTVANTGLTLNEPSKTYNVNTDAVYGNISVVLSTNGPADNLASSGSSQSRVKTVPVLSAVKDDQWTLPNKDTGWSQDPALHNPGGTRYREDMYFLANSINGTLSGVEPDFAGNGYNADDYTATSMTQEELDYILAGKSGIETDLKAYFGLKNTENLDDLEIRSVATSNGAVNVLALKGGDVLKGVNPFFTNYFTVSPSGVDSQRISIVPRRITRFDYESIANDSSLTLAQRKTKIEDEAAKRHLVAEVSLTADAVVVNRIYYPLRLIVYDRLTVGYVANTTTFLESDFDVITLNVSITNSAPTLSDLFEDDITPATGAATLKGRTVEVAKEDYVRYTFTDIFSDAEMIIDGTTGGYRTKTQVEQAGGIVADTGDYLKSTPSGRLALVEFIDLGSGIGTNEYNTTNKKDGAIGCEVTDSDVTIRVHARARKSTSDGVAACIKLTFTDRYGESVSLYVSVKIINAAPTLTAEATNVRNIEMKTGDYFVLYTTPYDKFLEGANRSETVGDAVTDGAGNVIGYDGTYFDMINNVNDNSSSLNLTGFEKWSYDGPVGNTHYTSLPNMEIGAVKYNEVDHKDYNKTNLGYMAIANDDAPWTLRIPRNRGVGYDASVDSSLLEIRTLNILAYEGARDLGCTALLFEAKGAFNDAEIWVTVRDGANTATSNPKSVTYKFRITVISTPPVAITSSNETTDHVLGGESLKEGDPMFGRLEHSTEQSTTNPNIYNLRMKVGEKISLRTADFATDIDEGDSSKMYLLPRSGDNPFLIEDSSTAVNGDTVSSTMFVALKHSNGNSSYTEKSVEFSIEALNFHNGAADNKLYSEVQFYICDPHFASVDKSVLIKLRVYVYPSDVEAANSVANSKSVKVHGVTASTDAEVVKLVGTTDKDGAFFIDNDALADNTKYSVDVYTLSHYKLDAAGNFVLDGSGNKVIEHYSQVELNNIINGDNTTLKNSLLVAQHVVAADGTVSNSSYLSDDKKSAYIVGNYLGAIEFSENGTEMYITPARATNNLDLPGTTDGSKGFRLAIAVKKHIQRSGANIGFGPDYEGTGKEDPDYKENAFAAVSVDNSSPEEVGNTDRNIGKHINVNASTANDSRAYLSMQGKRGDSWIYYLYNNSSEDDEALFRDPDGDAITYSGKEITGLYTYEYDDKGNANRVSHKENAAAMESAGDAFSVLTRTSVPYPYGDSGVNVASYPALEIRINHKVDIPNVSGRTVYIEILLKGKDPYSSQLAETTITLGIDNSEPSFKSSPVTESEGGTPVQPADLIDSKYTTGGNSYFKEKSSIDAAMTLTLNKDKVYNSKDYGLEDENGNGLAGVFVVPITDFMTDADYDATTSYERFTFAETKYEGIADMATISGKSASWLWLNSDGKYGVVTDKPDNCVFTVQVLRDTNNAIVFTVDSFDRGATAQLVLTVCDRDGAKTGVLTITLVVGNSKPIDKTILSNDDPNKVNPNIMIAGGNNGTGENGAFVATKYSIRQFVTDNNPDDNVEIKGEPSTATNYLRITSYTEGIIRLDNGETIDPGNDNGGSSSGGSEQPKRLVEFVTDFTQTFEITPVKGMTGTQTINITVSDGGNRYSDDSETITLSLVIRVIEDPNSKQIFDYHVYWCRTMEITPESLFDNPETDGVESNGILIKKVVLGGSGTSPNVSISQDAATGAWMVTGNTRTAENSPIDAVATVIVGTEINDNAIEYQRNFKIYVDDNLKPYFKTNSNGVSYDKGVTNIYKGDINEDGIWEISVTQFFDDHEGDTLSLVSASSVKSTLIDVTADTQRNMFVFNFKSRGDTTIRCKVRDAVSTYDYEFKIGNVDLPAPNFFIGIIARVQENPWMFIAIACGVLLLLIILIAIIAAVHKKKKMRAEIEALLVSEMELEEQMLKLAAGPSPTSYQAYGYLPPTPNVPQQPGLMLGSGQGGADPNAAIGLNPGAPQNTAPRQSAPETPLPPIDNGFSDDDL